VENLCNEGVDGKEKLEFMEMTELRDRYEICRVIYSVVSKSMAAIASLNGNVFFLYRE
jgi:hypothetical protein